MVEAEFNRNVLLVFFINLVNVPPAANTPEPHEIVCVEDPEKYMFLAAFSAAPDPLKLTI